LVETCLHLTLLTHEALNFTSFLMFLVHYLQSLILQTLHLLLILLVVLCLTHPQVFIIHPLIMHLLSELVIVVIFKFKDLLGLVLGLLNLFECS